MEPKRQREIALAAVAAAMLAVAAYRIRSSSFDGSTPATPSSSSSTSTAPKTAAGTKNGPIPDVALGLLNASRPEPAGVARNPFRFKPKPPPPAPPQTMRMAPPQQAGPMEPPPLPRIPLKFIGRMDSEKAGQVAILSDGHGVYYGHEGETVEGRYRIIRIGVESIELAYLDGRGRQTIRLTGQ
jgi:hypothetical protein